MPQITPKALSRNSLLDLIRLPSSLIAAPGLGLRSSAILQVLEKPYRILYRIDEENRIVFVVAVLHQTQDLLSAWRSQKRS